MVKVADVQAAIASSGAAWKAATNFLTGLTPAERELYLGYNPPSTYELDARERSAQIKTAAIAQFTAPPPNWPASWDWRHTASGNFVTPVKDQGRCGSCVAFGTVAPVESMMR